MARHSDTHCYCGAYLPADVRRAGKSICGSCERQEKREAAHYDQVNALIDAVDAHAANDTNGQTAVRGSR